MNFPSIFLVRVELTRFHAPTVRCTLSLSLSLCTVARLIASADVGTLCPHTALLGFCCCRGGDNVTRVTQAGGQSKERKMNN